MRDSTPYNGWTNYATWRVKLEIFGGIPFVKEDFFSADEKPTIADLAMQLKNTAENIVSEHGEIKYGLALAYAAAFMGDVNWHEIAESMAEDNPELLAP